MDPNLITFVVLCVMCAISFATGIFVCCLKKTPTVFPKLYYSKKGDSLCLFSEFEEEGKRRKLVIVPCSSDQFNIWEMVDDGERNMGSVKLVNGLWWAQHSHAKSHPSIMDAIKEMYRDTLYYDEKLRAL